MGQYQYDWVLRSTMAGDNFGTIYGDGNGRVNIYDECNISYPLLSA